MEMRVNRQRELPRVLVFGGTSEGRELAQWLNARGTCQVTVSSLTEYGGSLVEGMERVQSITGQMDEAQMERLIRDGGFSCVVDATHPYAVRVSQDVAESARACAVRYYRVLREGEPEGPWVGFDTAEQAAAYVARQEGRVLLTTGSKDLAIYAKALENCPERLFVRILPVAQSLAAADELGIPASRIIAMQGPFSQELNEALLRELDIATMVTKASGAAGGFWEKVRAAQACGVQVVVVHRPPEQDGLSLGQLQEALARELGL